MPLIHAKYDVLTPLSELKQHPKNRNEHSLEQVQRLGKLFEYHGIRHPIIVSKRTGFIVAGHARLLAARHIDMREFPVVYQGFDSDEAEYAFLVADNAIAEWAELDLGGVNSDLGDLGPDFDLELLGLKGFLLEPLEKFIAEDHWTEDFEPPDRFFRIIVSITSDDKKEEFLKALGLSTSDIKKKTGRVWSIHWPE